MRLAFLLVFSLGLGLMCPAQAHGGLRGQVGEDLPSACKSSTYGGLRAGQPAKCTPKCFQFMLKFNSNADAELGKYGVGGMFKSPEVVRGGCARCGGVWTGGQVDR